MKHLFKILFSSKFKYFGKNVALISPDSIQGEEYIKIDDNTLINSMAWLLALKTRDEAPYVNIGKNVYIGRFFHLVSIREVIIQDNVLIADKVYISDNIHEYQDISLPIKDQPIKFKNKVVIGKNSWLGENVSIIGAQIGKHCIIGSNSVVNKNIPDYCMAVGSPAKIIKRYNNNTNEWDKTDTNGEFFHEK
jgi:acetyltransferase-like isoleucine patch superfamily enzyme